MNDDELGEHQAPPAPPAPVPVAGTVHVGRPVDNRPQAADYGAYSTITTPAGADTARIILPFDARRRRATITVSAPGAQVAGSGVWIGTQAQCQASPPVGGFLPAGISAFPVEHAQPVWMTGDGTNSLRVTIAIERWHSEASP
jgi:hypothetical protein